MKKLICLISFVCILAFYLNTATLNGSSMAGKASQSDLKSAEACTLAVIVTPQNTPFCVGDMIPLTATVSGSQAVDYDFAWSDHFKQIQVPSPAQHTVDIPGNYNVVVTDQVAICSATSNTVHVSNAITIDLTPNSQNICNDGQAQLIATVTGGIAPYTATLSDGSMTTGNSPFTFTVSPNATTTYTVTSVVDKIGCLTLNPSNAVTVDVTALGTTISASPLAICSGGSSIVTVDVIGGSDPTVTLSDGQTKTGPSPLVFTVMPSTTTTYTVTSVTSNGCTVMHPAGSATVTVDALSVALAPPTQSVCIGKETQLTATVTGGIAPYTARLSDGSVAMGHSPLTFTVSPSVTTMYTVTSVVDAMGCSTSSASNNVVVNAVMLNASLTAQPTSIFGEKSSLLTLNVQGSSGPLNVAWSDGFVQTNVFSPVTRTVKPSKTISYFATVTDSNGCITQSPTVTVNVRTATPIHVKTTRPVINRGQSATLLVTADAQPGLLQTASERVTLFWSDGTVDPNVTLPFKRVVRPSKTTAYSVTAQNAAGVRSTSNAVTIRVQPAPAAFTVHLNSLEKCVCPLNCAHISGTIKGGKPPFKLYWSDGSHKTIRSHTIHRSVCPFRKTSYSVKVRDAAGNSNTSNKITARLCKAR